MFQVIAVSFIIFIIACTSQWVSITDPSLPRASENHAIAAYADSIFIMGGNDYGYQLVEYQISSNTIIDHGVSVLPAIAFNHGAYFSQWQNILYMHRSDILVYDVSSPSFPSVSTIAVDSTVDIGTAACIASSADRLFVLGGWTSSTVPTVHTLTLSDSTWSTAPSMNTNRVDSACIVAYDYLYVIGGWLTQIERMNINDMNGFDNIGSLTTAVSMSGVALHGDIIWVIGGFDANRDAVDEVWNIDTNDGSVVLLNERLPYAIVAGFGGTIIAKDVLYVFGGRAPDKDTKSAHWVKLSLARPATALPTKNPTKYPTNIPSKQPSSEPSKTPTSDPAGYDPTPTDIPSNSPTVHEEEGEVVEETSDNDVDDDGDDDDGNDNEQQTVSYNVDTIILITIVILVSVFVFLLCCCICLLKRFKQVKAIAVEEIMEETNETVLQNFEMKSYENRNSMQPSQKQEGSGEMVMNPANVNTVGGEDDDDDDSLVETFQEGIMAEIKAGINDGCIENDMVQGNITMGAPDDEMVQGSDNIMEKNMVQGSDHSDEELGIHGTCSDCGKMEKGKVYDENGLFYCLECWKYYETNVDGGEMIN